MPFRPLFPCVPWSRSSDISKSKNAGKQGTKRHKSSGRGEERKLRNNKEQQVQKRAQR